MNRALVDPIANAVLYEGYILYPYRPSVKNRQRWTFGGLYPESYRQAQGGGESSGTQTECLVHGTPATTFEAAVRFLHLTARLVGRVAPPLAEWPEGGEPPSRPVEALRVGDQVFQTWQEAEEREVFLGAVALGELLDRPRSLPFAFPGGRRVEPVRGEAGEVVGTLAREQQAVEGVVDVSAAEAGEGLFRLSLRVVNRTPMGEDLRGGRDGALLRALVSTHAVLGVDHGAFVSLLEPPECLRGHLGVPERRHLAGPGRRGRAEGPDALVTDHPVRLPAGRAGEPGRLLRRHGDRRDADAPDHDPDRRGEARDDRGGRPSGRPAGADRGAGARPVARAPWRGPRPAPGVGEGAP